MSLKSSTYFEADTEKSIQHVVDEINSVLDKAISDIPEIVSATVQLGHSADDISVSVVYGDIRPSVAEEITNTIVHRIEALFDSVNPSPIRTRQSELTPA